MVCARALRDLCAEWMGKGRVDDLVSQAMTFGELKQLLGVDDYLNLRSGLQDP